MLVQLVGPTDRDCLYHNTFFSKGLSGSSRFLPSRVRVNECRVSIWVELLSFLSHILVALQKHELWLLIYNLHEIKVSVERTLFAKNPCFSFCWTSQVSDRKTWNLHQRNHPSSPSPFHRMRFLRNLYGRFSFSLKKTLSSFNWSLLSNRRLTFIALFDWLSLFHRMERLLLCWPCDLDVVRCHSSFISSRCWQRWRRHWNRYRTNYSLICLNTSMLLIFFLRLLTWILVSILCCSIIAEPFVSILVRCQRKISMISTKCIFPWWQRKSFIFDCPMTMRPPINVLNFGVPMPDWVNWLIFVL